MFPWVEGGGWKVRSRYTAKFADLKDSKATNYAQYDVCYMEYYSCYLLSDGPLCINFRNLVLPSAHFCQYIVLRAPFTALTCTLEFLHFLF